MNITSSGDFKNLEKFLKVTSKKSKKSEAINLAEEIVRKLKMMTPVKSSKTANSWSYTIKETSAGIEIEIINTNNNGPVNIAKLIHYGHGTGTGGYVSPKPFITEVIDSVYKNKIDSILKSYLR